MRRLGPPAGESRCSTHRRGDFSRSPVLIPRMVVVEMRMELQQNDAMTPAQEVRLSVSLHPALVAKIEWIAERQGVSMEGVIRCAVVRCCAEEPVFAQWLREMHA